MPANPDACEKTPLKNGPATICGVTLQAAVVRIVTCIVSFAEGYDGAIFGAVATRLVKEFDLTPRTLGLLAGIVPMAMIIGAPLAGVFTNYMGRKPLLFILCIVIAFGAAIQASAATVFVLAIGRFFIGLATGAGLTTVTVYVAEASPAKVRGLLTSLEEIFLNIGMSAAFGVSWMLLGPYGIDWRDAMLVGVFFPLIAASMLPWSWCPESPRYHLLCGRVEEARIAMTQLGISNEEAEGTIQAWTNRPESNNAFENMQIHQRSMLLAIGVAMMSMLTGIVALHNLMPWVLASKMPEEEALRWSTIISTIKFVILIPVCFQLLDHVGRRPLFCCSSFMFAVAAAFTAIAFASGFPGEVVGVGYGCVVCSFSGGIGPVTWPYIAEVLPTVIRGSGTGIALSFGRICSMVWMVAFPMLFAWRAEVPLWIVAILTSMSCAFFFLMCPETMQKTLENIRPWSPRWQERAI